MSFPFIKYILVVSLTLYLTGCAKPRSVRLPPVSDGWKKVAVLRKSVYKVQPNDTLYSIAWAFGMDYRDLARVNNLTPPYSIRRGQRLFLAPPTAPKKGLQTRAIFGAKSRDSKPLYGWVWPTSGKIISSFNNKIGGNKGINIGGTFGQPIVASNSGTVVYSGTGIISYGKLIIIKHNEDYLSAYAYNREMLVAEGDTIKIGQKIATMGRDNSGKTCLHFEIRRLGQPINPILSLPKKL